MNMLLLVFGIYGLIKGFYIFGFIVLFITFKYNFAELAKENKK